MAKNSLPCTRTQTLVLVTWDIRNLSQTMLCPALVAQWWVCQIMTRCLWVQSPAEANFLFGLFRLSPLQKHVRKVVAVFGKKSCVNTGETKARKHMCVTDHHDMTLAIKVALNPNTTNHQTILVCTVVGKKNIWKTWEKSKMKVTSVLFFFHDTSTLSKESFINPFPHNDTFWCPWKASPLKTLWEK